MAPHCVNELVVPACRGCAGRCGPALEQGAGNGPGLGLGGSWPRTELRDWRVREVTPPKRRRWGWSRPGWSQKPPPLVLPGPSPLLIGVGFLVGHELAVDDVGEPPFEGAESFHRGFAGGELAPVVGPAFGVVVQLNDRHEVQHPVDPPVAGSGDPVAELRSRSG